MMSSLSTVSPPLLPRSHRSNGNSRSSRSLSWREKLSPFHLKSWRPKKEAPGLELQSTVDDDLLLAVKQVVRIILENKEQEVTKGNMYRVLRKFAQCQVDIQQLRQQLRKATLELERQQKKAPDGMDRSAPLATVPESEPIFDNISSSDSGTEDESSLSQKDGHHMLTSFAEIFELQQLILDLERLHTQQCSKYQDALIMMKDVQGTCESSRVAQEMQLHQSRTELEQQRSATRLCEQVIAALRDTILEKDAIIHRQKIELEMFQGIKFRTPQDFNAQNIALAKQSDGRQRTHSFGTANINSLDKDEKATSDRLFSVREETVERKGAMISPDMEDDPKPPPATSHIVDTLSAERVVGAKMAGFMLSPFDEVSHSQLGYNTDARDQALEGDHFDRKDNPESQNPRRIDELRKRRNSQEEKMKEQFSRIKYASSAMTGQTTAQSPDRKARGNSSGFDSGSVVSASRQQVAVDKLQMLVEDRTIKLDAAAC